MIGAFTRRVLARACPAPDSGRSLNLCSNFDPSLAHVEQRVAVLNKCLLRPQLSGPRFTKNLKSDRNRKNISGAKKIII